MYIVYVIIPYEEIVMTYNSFETAKMAYDETKEFWGNEYPVGLSKVIESNGVEEE